MGIGHVGLILGVVALILGGSGLAIALTNSGHTGATGATGAQGIQGVQGAPGAPGPGAVVNESFNTGTTVLAVDVCTYYAGSNTSIRVTGPGSFAVTASVEMQFDHTNGVPDAGYISLVNTSASCSPTSYNFDRVSAPPGMSTDAYLLDYSLTQTLEVGAAGAYAFGIIGDQVGGTDTVEFYYASVVVTFYPS